MTKKMLVDATHPEETRVAMVDGNWLSDFDFERASKKQLKGNIYLAKVIRIEPSLQAAFVEYGGNRHGFLPFSEIHPDYFRIPMADRPHDAPPDEADAEDEDDEDTDGDSEGGDTGFDPDYAAIEAGDVEASDTDMAHDEIELVSVHENENAGENIDSGEDMPSQTSHETMASSEVIVQASEFDSGVSEDHGLITDFGNAVVAPAMPDAAPIETVGGESAEEEPRYRHPPRPRYKIQEVVKRRQVMLIQVVKEERGNKGAALTTFLSLAGRYCVLMPNTDHGGGVSRKITSHQDRRRMKEILDQLDIPEGMAVILRTAGMEKDPPEIQRDLEYLLRLWNNIREQTLQSTAPALIYEEANLIKRSLRDLYSHDLQEILVAGQKGYQVAIDFMRTIMPDHLDKVKSYDEPVPLFFRYNVEKYIDQLYNPVVQLRSGGYIVINPTEALVSIDVNSGRATRERHIESTAVKTNLEAAEEIARQLRLRDLAGLVVIDFIDMEDGRNNAAVERRIKESMKADRARLQIGRISPFGLLELSRQRLHPSLMEINFEKCPHCTGIGLVRSVDSAAISILRLIEEEAIRQGVSELVIHIPTKVALYILNQKRESLVQIEQRYNMQVLLHSDDSLSPPDYRIERTRGGTTQVVGPLVNSDQVFAETEAYRTPASTSDEEPGYTPPREGEGQDNPERRGGRGRYGQGRNRNRGDRNRGGERNGQQQHTPQDRAPGAAPAYPTAAPSENMGSAEAEGNDSEIVNETQHQGGPEGSPEQQQRRRRRGRRGGRGRRLNADGTPRDPQQPREGLPRDGQPRDPQQPRENHARDHQPREGQPREGNPNQGGHQRRDGNRDRGPRPPRGDRFNNDRKGNWDAGNGYSGNVAVPSSVHELDTTPRDPRSERSGPEGHSGGQRPQNSERQSAPSPYEVVSDNDSDKPKGGWWRRLTGQ